MIRRYERVYSYNHQEVSYYFWVKTDGNTSPDTVILLGAGQVGAIARRATQLAPTGVVIVQGIPTAAAAEDGSDILDYSSQFVKSAIEAILETINQPAVHIIAESQAAPGVLHFVCSSPQRVRNIALLRPLGFSASAFGDSPESRLKEFKRRGRLTFFQLLPSLLINPRNLVIPVTLSRAFMAEPSKAAFSNKYAQGVSYDATDIFKQAAKVLSDKGSTLTIFLAEKDRLFPPSEVLETLKAVALNGIDVVVTPKMYHASLALSSGKATVLDAVNTARRSKARA